MRFLICLAAILLTACVASSEPPAPPPLRPAKPLSSTPPPISVVTVSQPQGHWTDWPLTPGDWVYVQDERGSIGYFGQSGQNAIVTIRCDKARQRVYLSRSGRLVAPPMVVKTSSIAKTLVAANTGNTPAYIAVDLSPTDPILDAMAYSRGRFTVEAEGHVSLALPAWAEIGRVVEDCRS